MCLDGTAVQQPEPSFLNENGPIKPDRSGPFTVPSSDQTVNITNNLKDGAYVTYVEIDGPVAKNSLGQHPR